MRPYQWHASCASPWCHPRNCGSIAARSCSRAATARRAASRRTSAPACSACSLKWQPPTTSRCSATSMRLQSRRRCSDFGARRRLVPTAARPQGGAGSHRLQVWRALRDARAVDGAARVQRRILLRNSQNLRFLAEQGKNQIWKQPRWSAAAWHLSSFGTRAQLRQKLATWGHANLFDEHAHPGSLSEARLARCAEHCLVPDSPTVGATPSCVDGAPGNQRLPAKRIGSIAELSQLDLPPYLAHHRANFSEYFAYAVHLPRTKKRRRRRRRRKRSAR